jgi:hypothetical protein
MGAKYNIYFDKLFACLKYFSCHLVLVTVLSLNCKLYILLPGTVSLAELYLRCVYLNLFGWRGRDVRETR